MDRLSLFQFLTASMADHPARRDIEAPITFTENTHRRENHGQAGRKCGSIPNGTMAHAPWGVSANLSTIRRNLDCFVHSRQFHLAANFTNSDFRKVM
jgi:hypothetical protein